MNDPPFLLNHRAFLGYNTITPQERAALNRVLVPLVDRPANQWPTAGAVRLDSAELLFMVRVDDSLRAIVRPAADGQPELVDLVRHETLERYFKATGPAPLGTKV